MRHTLFSLIFCLSLPCRLTAQEYTEDNVFAHNDYVRASPFHTAYNLGVGYIEADVFLEQGNLMVAHHAREIAPGKDLESLYLRPLQKEIERNNGFAYANKEKSLTLMIDLKSEGPPTLNTIVDVLKKYPQIVSCRNLRILISGNVPDPKTWNHYPAYIYFDGRPAIAYDPEQLKRVGLISTSFRSISTWDGLSELAEDDRRKIASLTHKAHSLGKKFRFWATPDFPEAWNMLMELDLDVIVTDDVAALVDFLKTRNH